MLTIFIAQKQLARREASRSYRMQSYFWKNFVCCCRYQVVEGNHIFNYNVKLDSPFEAEYHAGGSQMVEPWLFGSIANELGETSKSSKCQFYGALTRFVIIRGNVIENNGGSFFYLLFFFFCFQSKIFKIKLSPALESGGQRCHYLLWEVFPPPLPLKKNLF